ncbi:MAG: peptide ABC transporter substrate-binding protein [Nitrospirae bacterium]|nr:peptide ABC transporter substrate-binding protein [Nitrospirota bacterium]
MITLRYFLFLFFLITISCSNKTPSDTSSALRLNISGEPPTLDWTLATDSTSFHVITSLMDGLTQFDDRLNPIPAVAKKWVVSNNGKRYTFYLRDDVYWTDGAPVTAYDFEFSWKRLLSPDTAAEYAYFLYDINNAQEFNSGKIKDFSLVGIKAVDKHTLVVDLKKPTPYFPSITTFMVTFPLRRDIVGKHGSRWTEPENIVTNGPFILHKWKHEYKIELRPNKRYYAGKPLLDKIEMFMIGETSTALTLYETGGLDIAGIPPIAIPHYKNNPEYRNLPILRNNYYGFNVTKPPFNDVRIRKAFSMAIDRSEFPKILKGGELPAASWIPKGMLAYNPDIGLKYNPDEAKRLLKEAGYPDGKGFPKATVAFNTNLDNQMIAENLQAQWKRNLNVSVELDNQEWKVYLKRLKTDAPAIFRLGWGADFPDPDNFMNLFTTDSGNNNTKWSNKKYDKLIELAAIEMAPEKRIKLYNEAQRILCEIDAPIMPLFISAQNVSVKPYVKGYRLNSMDILYLKDVKIEGR